MNKTSLEKSHSKWSNFKLTSLCVLASISFSLFWLAVGFKDHLDTVFFFVALGVTAFVSLLCIIGFHCFKR